MKQNDQLKKELKEYEKFNGKRIKISLSLEEELCNAE